jgi:cyclohexanone monooxygenase
MSDGGVALAAPVPGAAPAQAFDAIIVGAGLAGLYQLYRLRQLGLRVRVLEAAPDIGGTWYWNRYPGARCDIESMSYAYSFSPELEQEWTWSERYATQPEILRYINHVADWFKLRGDIEFETRVAQAAFDEADGRWTVHTDGEAAYSGQYLILAVGCLSMPKPPEVPGLDRFEGRSYLTARWPHEPVDFSGQRVGVIGTGSSGVQVIPVIAEQAASLTVFQRTPSYTLPAKNRPLTEEEVADRKANYARWRESQRASYFGDAAPRPTKSALEVSAREQRETYQRGWELGALNGVVAAFYDILSDEQANETAADFVRSKIDEIVTEPAVAEALSPRSYPFGTKRPCLGTNYFDTFNRANVRLVDIGKNPLTEITEHGIQAGDQHYDLDAIVFATGFDAVTGAIRAIDIRGRNGQSLRDDWASGPRNYLGLAVAGFPNLFTITGPLSPSVLSNMVLSIEEHVNWITACIASMRDRGYTRVEATAGAQDKWVLHVREVGAATLFPRAESWYMGANVPGKPRTLLAYVGGVPAYHEKVADVAARDYEGFEFR